MYFSALKSWYIMNCLWMSSKIFARITVSQKSPCWSCITTHEWNNYLHASRFPCIQISDRCLCHFLPSGHSTIWKRLVYHHHRNERNLRNVLKPDNILMVVDLLQEHDFAKRSLENVRFDDAWRLELRDPTWASVAFWNASKIFFKATTSRVFLSTDFQTTPYACISSSPRVSTFETIINGTSLPPFRAFAVFRTFVERAYRSLRSWRNEKEVQPTADPCLTLRVRKPRENIRLSANENARIYNELFSYAMVTVLNLELLRDRIFAMEFVPFSSFRLRWIIIFTFTKHWLIPNNEWRYRYLLYLRTK